MSFVVENISNEIVMEHYTLEYLYRDSDNRVCMFCGRTLHRNFEKWLRNMQGDTRAGEYCDES